MSSNNPITAFIKENEELDFLCNHARSLLYDKRPFVTKKKKWSFHCINCEQKFSSDNLEMTHYYVWNYPELGAPISKYQHELLCSIQCLHGMLVKINLDVYKWNNKIKIAIEEFEALEVARRRREIREKEDAFMKKFLTAPKYKKRRQSK